MRWRRAAGGQRRPRRRGTWNAATGADRLLAGPRDADLARFSPDGQHVASASFDGPRQALVAAHRARATRPHAAGRQADGRHRPGRHPDTSSPLRSDAGFTLVELLAAMALSIVVLLATLMTLDTFTSRIAIGDVAPLTAHGLDGTRRLRLKSHRGRVNAVVFSPDDRHALSGSDDGELPAGRSSSALVLVQDSQARAVNVWPGAEPGSPGSSEYLAAASSRARIRAPAPALIRPARTSVARPGASSCPRPLRAPPEISADPSAPVCSRASQGPLPWLCGTPTTAATRTTGALAATATPAAASHAAVTASARGRSYHTTPPSSVRATKADRPAERVDDARVQMPRAEQGDRDAGGGDRFIAPRVHRREPARSASRGPAARPTVAASVTATPSSRGRRIRRLPRVASAGRRGARQRRCRRDNVAARREHRRVSAPPPPCPARALQLWPVRDARPASRRVTRNRRRGARAR